MTNREFYKERILDIVCGGAVFGVAKKDNSVHSCYELGCQNCRFNSNDCYKVIKEWADTEYVEPCEFEEDELVEVSDNGVNWCLRHFARIDDCGSYKRIITFINGKTSKETKDTISWEYCRKYGTLGGLVKGE